jgi:flagellar protein FlaG
MNIQSVNTLSLAPNAQRSTTVDTAPVAKRDTPANAIATAHEPTSPLSIKPSEEELKDVVKAVNDFVNPFNNSLQFSIDKDSDTMVVKVIDTSTKEVIKQIPSEEMLALAKALDQLKGLLVKQKA